MRRIAQLSLPKRAMTYTSKGIHLVSDARGTTCFQLQMNDKAQALRKQIKELSSEFSKAQLHYVHRNLLEKPDMIDKDSIRVSVQERQYRKEILSTFFELMKLVNTGKVTLLSEDLIDFHFEDQQNPAYMNINNLQAWICRQLIKLNGGDEEVLTTLATCIEKGAKIEEEDLYRTLLESYSLKEIQFTSDLRKLLVTELQERASSFKTKYRPK